MKKRLLLLTALVLSLFSLNAQRVKNAMASNDEVGISRPLVAPAPQAVMEQGIAPGSDAEAIRALKIANAQAQSPSDAQQRAAAIVTWVGPAAGGDWQVGSNWSSGAAPGASDDVQLNTASTLILTNVPTSTIASLTVDGTTTAHLRAAAAATILTIAGTTGVDLSVGAGSTLNLNGALTQSLVLAADATGSINGTVQLGGAAHRLLASSASALTFGNGSLFRAFPGFTGNPFGTTTLNSVVFASGSIYSAKYGGTPFGPAGPNTVCVFQTGSLYRMDTLGATHSFTNRTYGDVEVNVQLLNTVFSVGVAATPGTLNLDNLILTQGAFGFWNFGTVNINGNITQGNALPTTTLLTIGHPTAAPNGILNCNLNSATGSLHLAAGATSTFYGIQIHNAAGGTTTVSVVNGANFTTSRSIYCGNSNSNMRIASGGTMNFSPTIFCAIGSPADGTGGKYSVEAGGTIGIGTANGIYNAPTLLGNVQSQTRVYDAGGHYVYNRNLTGNAETGTGLPSAITGSLTLNFGAAANGGLILTNSTTVNGTLNLTNGKFILNANNLVLGAAATLNGGSANSFAATNSTGAFTRPNVGATPVEFPVGYWITSYDPVRIENAGTVDAFSVVIDDLPATVLDSTKLVWRSYNIAEGTPGGSDATLTLTYSATAAVGSAYNTANPIFIGHYNAPAWTETSALLVGTSANAAGFTSFSPFVVGNSQAQTWHEDADGDGFGNASVTLFALNQPAGYVLDGTDCDDNNAAIHTPITYYADADGDGYGNPSSTTDFCLTAAPSGFASNSDDCDDADSSVPTNYYPDGDGDGYGLPGGTPSFGCGAPVGYAGSDDDCDDNNAGINPGATEICGNSIDENCDGSDGLDAFTHTLSAFNCSSGKATVTITSVMGGTPPFKYSKNGGTTYQTSNIFLNVSPGAYTFVVKDATGCTKSQPIAVNSVMVLSTSATPVLCYGDANGVVNGSVASGGYPDFDYEWFSGTTLISTAQMVTGLTAGTYIFKVTDNVGCTKSANVAVGTPALMKAKLTKTNPTCNGYTNGAISTLITGGVPVYSYAWSNGSSDATLSGVGAGTYTVSVTDANGCGLTSSATLTQPLALTVNIAPKNPKCFGGSDGSAKATAAGGTGTKTYLWSNGGTTQEILGLPAGTYTVSITDANGCMVTGSTTLVAPAQLLITGIASAPSGANYTVTVTATGGTTPRKYTRITSGGTVFNGTAAGVFSNVPAGTYTFKVTDKNLCSVMQSQSIPVTFTLGNERGGASKSATSFTLVPNPAHGAASLVFEGQMPTTGSVEVRNSAGQLVKRADISTLTNGQLALDGLRSGVLFVTFRATDGTATTKRLVLMD